MSTAHSITAAGRARPAPDPLMWPSRWSEDNATLHRILAGLREPEVPDAVAGSDHIYDDLESVLGVQAEPSPGEVEELTQRMRAALITLSDDLLRKSHEGSAYMDAELAGRMSALCAQAAPVEFVAARGHLRRLAMAALEALDLLAQPFGDPRPAGGPVGGPSQIVGQSGWSA
ncbi:DUF6415 family natural product biosynthesis protein [Streptomyces sp. NPDC093085]|uniref:DUF6415 family natural product biosynthesis protein n=1 Tax=Streptomyces sp. NPDC093085 TaxID=3155068 RepID=UPI003446F77D